MPTENINNFFLYQNFDKYMNKVKKNKCTELASNDFLQVHCKHIFVEYVT